MIFKKVTVNNQLRTDLILYSETGLEDYLFNHVLTVIDNTLVPQDTINFARLAQMPDHCIASDRQVGLVVSVIQNEPVKSFRLKPKRRS